MRTNTTDKQSEASRINGAKSQGPATPEGKQRSARNAIRHGLSSKDVVLSNESQEAFDELLAEYHRAWNPVGIIENDLVRDMAEARWRLRRIKAIETATLDSEMFIQRDDFEKAFDSTTPVMRQADAFTALNKINPAVIENLHKYEIRYDRAFHRAMKSLVQLQKLRKTQNEPDTITATPSDAVGQVSDLSNQTAESIPYITYQPNTPTPESFSWQATYHKDPD